MPCLVIWVCSLKVKLNLHHLLPYIFPFMDSGNSGSMQSSSGGDDESYDSRAESISALLGPTMTNHHQHPPQVAQHHQQLQTQHHRHHPHHHVEFDTLSNIFDSRLTNPNPLLNLDMVWSKTMRSDQSMADLGGQNELSQPFLTNSQLGGQVSRGGGGGGAGGGSSPFTQIPSSSAPNDQSLNNNNVGGVRNTNPKKRSRASRRAPTTVLTTDTTNFRAMVQEFTGIPAPPFTSSPFPRSRLDLFGSSASSMVRLGPGQNHTDPSSLPPYLLRPFPHKSPLLPSPSSPSLLPSSNSNANSNIGGSNLQQSQSLLNMNNMQNSSSSPSVLNFQSLFQNQQQPQSNLQKYPLPGSGNILGSSKSSQGSLGVLEDQFGLSHGLNVQQLPNIVSSSSSDGGLTLQQQQPRHDNNPRTTTTTTMNWVDNNNKNDGNVDLLRSVNGNYGNGKLNYAASSSSNVVDKAGVQLENNVSTTTARSEGMVESWICSSD